MEEIRYQRAKKIFKELDSQQRFLRELDNSVNEVTEKEKHSSAISIEDAIDFLSVFRESKYIIKEKIIQIKDEDGNVIDETICKKRVLKKPTKEEKKLKQEKDNKLNEDYQGFLTKLYCKMEEKNLTKPLEKQGITFTKPIIERENKKTIFINFNRVCESMKREENIDHVLKFLSEELKAKYDIRSENKIAFGGKYKVNSFIKILTRYVEKYIKCKECKKFNTELSYDKIIKTHCIKCRLCSCSYNISEKTDCVFS